MNCRTCVKPIAFHLTESDFLDDEGGISAVISKNVVCPECGAMNARYFSWEVEFGDAENRDRPFAAVPTAIPETEFWEPELMQAEMGEPQGTRRIGADENWMELSWNLSQRWAWLALYAMTDDLPLEIWHRRISIPEMPHEAGVDILRHLTHLANLLYSLYAASVDAMDLMPEMMDALLDLPLTRKISDARKGYLTVFAMRFHEELHRAQENLSRWGALWSFLRKTNQMDGYFHRPGEPSHVAAVHASNEQWLSLSHALTGSTSLSVRDAPNNVGIWRERMRKTEPERNLLKEIHAYWIAEVISVDDLYRHLYRNPHASYADLHRVDRAQFARLCETMDWLYAVYDGDLDKLVAVVGNAESIADFESKAKSMIDASDPDLLQQRRDQMRKEKQEWRDMTARLAQEFL